jgi:hypothetical protein
LSLSTFSSNFCISSKSFFISSSSLLEQFFKPFLFPYKLFVNLLYCCSCKDFIWFSFCISSTFSCSFFCSSSNSWICCFSCHPMLSFDQLTGKFIGFLLQFRTSLIFSMSSMIFSFSFAFFDLLHCRRFEDHRLRPGYLAPVHAIVIPYFKRYTICCPGSIPMESRSKVKNCWFDILLTASSAIISERFVRQS